MEELVSARIFSSWSVVQAIFLGLCMHFFSHSCCMIFLTVKALQEFFFLKSSTPSPSKIKWSTP